MAELESYKKVNRSLYRSERGKQVFGVCSGLAEHFNIDPILVRLIFTVLSLVNGLGLIIYGVLWLVLPRAIRAPAEAEGLEDHNDFDPDKGQYNVKKPGDIKAEKPDEDIGDTIVLDKRSPFFVYLVLGLVLIVVGFLFVLERLEAFFPEIGYIRLFWPVLLVIGGIVTIVTGAIKK